LAPSSLVEAMLLRDRGRVTGYGPPGMTVLRQGLLSTRAVALAGGPPRVLIDALRGAGARLLDLDVTLDEDRGREWAAAQAPIHALVYDAGPAFGAGGERALRAASEQAWIATRAVATGALIPAGAAKVVLIAPRPDRGPFAAAARAALENLARTLSVEWARYGVTAVAIAPGAASSNDDLAELVCYLVSPAGDYFDGCLFELGVELGSP
jgi:NAD(P)-dependent dehydrogenase (short-subunit alcohol dehydrogenase family)